MGSVRALMMVRGRNRAARSCGLKSCLVKVFLSMEGDLAGCAGLVAECGSWSELGARQGQGVAEALLEEVVGELSVGQGAGKL